MTGLYTFADRAYYKTKREIVIKLIRPEKGDRKSTPIIQSLKFNEHLTDEFIKRGSTNFNSFLH